MAELGEIIFWNATDIVRSPSPSLAPLPHRPAAAVLLFGLSTWTGIYCSLHHTGCLTVVWSPGQRKIGISATHKPPQHQSTSFKYISHLLCWISLVKLCKHIKKVLIYLFSVLFDTLSLRLPAILLTCDRLNATRALSHKDRFR